MKSLGMVDKDADVQLSVIVPVGVRHADIGGLYTEYAGAIASLGIPAEFIFVLDGPRPDVSANLEGFMQAGQRITIVSLTRQFGEATALMAGFEHSSGEIIATLPAYHQIVGGEIGKLVTAIETTDLAIGVRAPRAEGWLEGIRRKAFHRIVGSVTGMRLRDLGCGARVMRRVVLEEIALYGDQHRFLPILANRQGFRVTEVEVAQSPRDHFEGTYQPREYIHRVLDIVTVFFLVRFTKKPLRFFGMVGVSTFGIGGLLTLWLVLDRLIFGRPLADRPALLLSSLLVVLGLQLFALGLLGELIIFTHARAIKDYQVDRVIRFDDEAAVILSESLGRQVLSG
jgi:glycosyltransferase involved in cell wall biosynthesis